MEGFTVEEKRSAYGTKIKVVGVGGGGGNMINHMVREGVKGIDLIVANTDAQALEHSLASTKIQLGEKKTKGLGAGMVPAVGKESAEESYEEIRGSLEHADIVFIAAGLGGGTGTGAAPVVAQASKDNGSLTVCVVTRPFRFEGRKRAKLASQGLEELKKQSDSIVVIPNERLLTLVDKNLGYEDSFKLVDNVLHRAVSGMSDVVLSSGQSGINVDFADVKTIMGHRGMALMGVGEASGDDAAAEAVKNAIESPLLDDMTINGAMGVLVHFNIHPDCPLTDISDAMELVYDSVDEDADVIFGTITDKNAENNTVKVTIVATGFDSKEDEKELAPEPTISTTPDIKQIQRERITRLKKVSGGYDEQDVYSDLDMPSYLRRQQD